MGLRERLSANRFLRATVRPVYRFARSIFVDTSPAGNLRTVRPRRGGTTPLYLPKGYVYRRRPAYCLPQNYPGAEAATQPDVYAAAGRVAAVAGSETIIDLGCGRGMLMSLSGRYDIVGVDFGPNIEFCRATYDRGTWIDADFEKTARLALEPQVTQGSTLVCADVIEHLANPLRLLGVIRRMLGTASVAVISTPDRIRLHGPDHSGPPPNTYHVREWSIDELRALLESEQLEVAYSGWTRANTIDTLGSTILCICVSTTLPIDLQESVAAACREVVEAGLKLAE
jgi:SAM-dependent methyltransferase